MKKIFLILLLLFLLQANFASAQTLEIYYPPVPGADPPQVFLNGPPELLLANYAKYIVYLCMWAAGIIAMLGLAVGGLRYVLSTGNPEKLVNAREQIVSAFLGLLIILSAATILNIINPNLTNLEILPLSSTDIQGTDYTPPPEIAGLKSSIDPESPLGRVIEKVFEVYISEYPEPEEDELWTPRVIRLRNRALAALEMSEAVFAINHDLYEAAADCGCENTDIENGEGCWQYWNNPFECSVDIMFECTCDPCEPTRNDILDGEEENHNAVYLGDGITISNQMNRQWELETINTSLLNEILEQEEEVRLLKEQYDRLLRAEQYINDCPLKSLYSYTQFLGKASDIENKEGGATRIVDFWNDVSILYYRPIEIPPRYNPIPYEETELAKDYVAFYCDLSGTLEQPHVYSEDEAALEGEIELDSASELLDNVLSESLACSAEAPIGEYFDRVKRITNLIIENFDRIIELEKDLQERIDQFQEAISECSSRNCVHACIWIPATPVNPPVCIETYCQGSPCPDDVDHEFEHMIAIREEIDLLVNGEDPHDTPENVGLLVLIDEYVPILLEELQKNIRIPMKECTITTLGGKDRIFQNCSMSLGATNPDGEAVQLCCQTEENGQRTAFGDCYEECYLERSQADHRTCIYDCLHAAGNELGDDTLPFCMHELNFYCCHAGD